MDNIPLDVIRYVIMPMLDYHARLNLNISLKPEDRYSLCKFSQKRLLEHERHVFVQKQRIKLSKIESVGILDSEKRRELILDLFELLKQPSHKLLFNNKNYASVYVLKMKEFSEYKLTDSKYKKEIQDSVAFLSKNIPVYDVPYELECNKPITAFDESFTYKKNI